MLLIGVDVLSDKPTYLEFEDTEDPNSNAYKDRDRNSFRITVQPEMYLLALVENANVFEPDVLPAVRQLMYAAYDQGKKVGKLSAI